MVSYYAVEITTLPHSTSGAHSITQVYGLEANDAFHAITEIQRILQPAPNEIIRPVGLLTIQVAQALGLGQGKVQNIYTAI